MPIKMIRLMILSFLTDEWWLNEHKPTEYDCAEMASALLPLAEDETTSDEIRQAASELVSILSTKYEIERAAPHFDVVLGPKFRWCNRPFTVIGYMRERQNRCWRTMGDIQVPEGLNIVENDS